MKRRTPPPNSTCPYRTRHRLSHRPHVPMLMGGNTPHTTCSLPHRSRPTGNPPTQQPDTFCEEEWGGRDQTSRWMSMRTAPDCRQPPTERHASQSRHSTSHPPQQQDTVHRELCPCTGRGPTLTQDRCIVSHGRLRATTGPRGPRPRHSPPRRRSPTQT
jgi:hypothetical protein